MTEVGWELFFRTGLPQAYTFAKAAAQDDARKRTQGKREKRNQKETVQ